MPGTRPSSVAGGREARRRSIRIESTAPIRTPRSRPDPRTPTSAAVATANSARLECHRGLRAATLKRSGAATRPGARGAGDPALLRGGSPELCAAGHDPAAAGRAKKNGGFALAGARCTSCHDPHVSEGKALLAENLHMPFGEVADCGTCHQEAGTGPRPVELKEKGLGVCGSCHDFADKQKPKWAHAPVKRGQCFACHTPHASPREHLVKGGGADLCFQCHGDQARLIRELPRVHEPVLRGQCVKCHLPHGSPNPNMLAKKGNALCTACHDPKKPALQAAHRKAPATGECVRCHDPHSGARPSRKR